MLLGKNYDNAFYFSKVITQNIVVPIIRRRYVITSFLHIVRSRLRQHYILMWLYL